MVLALVELLRFAECIFLCPFVVGPAVLPLAGLRIGAHRRVSEASPPSRRRIEMTSFSLTPNLRAMVFA